MSKYIDADKLKAEIEKRLKNVRDYMNGAGMKYKGPKYFKAQGKESSYDALLSIVTSLQQEQPELSGYDKALLEVKSKVDKIYEGTSIGLNEYDSGLYNGIAETCMKLRGFIKARLDSDEQPEPFSCGHENGSEPKPEVDFEKEWEEFENWMESYNLGDYPTCYEPKQIASHFYELGLKARKEK